MKNQYGHETEEYKGHIVAVIQPATNTTQTSSPKKLRLKDYADEEIFEITSPFSRSSKPINSKRTLRDLHQKIGMRTV